MSGKVRGVDIAGSATNQEDCISNSPSSADVAQNFCGRLHSPQRGQTVAAASTLLFDQTLHGDSVRKCTHNCCGRCCCCGLPTICLHLDYTRAMDGSTTRRESRIPKPGAGGSTAEPLAEKVYPALLALLCQCLDTRACNTGSLAQLLTLACDLMCLSFLCCSPM